MLENPQALVAVIMYVLKIQLK